MKEEIGKLGLGEKSCHLGVVVRADADVESKTVSEREGEGLRAECEVVRLRNEFEDSTGVLEAESGEPLRLVSGLGIDVA